MESDLPLPNQESNEPKAEFRKLTNDAADRKYRRHSPMGGSSDEDDKAKRNHTSRGHHKLSDSEKMKDHREDDRRSNRSQHGRSSDSYRQSSRGDRYDEHSRYGKHADEDDRSLGKSHSRSGRESRGSTYSDLKDQKSDYDRSRDRYRDVDRYSRDRSDASYKKYKDKDSSANRTGYDGRHESRYDARDKLVRDRDNQDEKDYKSSRSHRRTSYEDSVRHQTLSDSKSDSGVVKDLDSSKHGQESRLKTDRLDRDEDGQGRTRAKDERKSGFSNEESTAKRPKLLSSENADARKGDVTSDSKLTSAANGSDAAASVDAAKVAAIRAAELVNKNLTSTGFMTADQKKKLLWGNKKSTTTEESSNRWDSATFSDRERQEKFNKLMGVKGEVKVNSKSPSDQDSEKLQLDLEKQYTAGLRRRDGRTVGLGL